MTSIIKVNTIQDAGGNALLTSNGSGTLTTNNIGGNLKPAFSAYLSANQTASDATWTKVECNTEVLDSDGTYDNSTNYRWTPASTGYYLICAGVYISCTENTMVDNYISLYKNGSQVSVSAQYGNSSSKSTWNSHTFNQIINCTSTSDYYELYGYADPTSGSVTFKGNSTVVHSYFNGFKLIT